MHETSIPAANMVTFYHDIEQNVDTKVSPEECRQVVRDFLSIEKKYGVPVTYNIVGKLFQLQPDLIELIIKNNQEVAFHSYNHPCPPRPEGYSREVDLCRTVSPLPCGYRSPRSMWNKSTLESLWRNGFLWSAESDLHSEPYFIHGGLVRLPIAIDDWPLHTGSLTVHEWVQQFSYLTKSRRYFAIGIHDCYTSLAPEERLRAWEGVLRLAIETKTLLVTFSQAADLYRRAMLSQFYTENAQGWSNRYSSLYRTKRFREMVMEVTEKMNDPVIADLGSGGDPLSYCLRNMAKKIYCVDNAPGMIREVESKEFAQPVLHDVTASGLPSDSIDFVICSRIVEYLFDPKDFADEIKRIGKVGATYFVTFPALSEDCSAKRSHERDRYLTPESRVRHYFSKDEVRGWADQIGPGYFIGIQYEEPEPDGPETEQRYRSLERAQPSGRSPITWVALGTIQNKSLRKGRKAIPLGAFEFHSKRSLKEYVMTIGLHFPKPIRNVGKWVLHA